MAIKTPNGCLISWKSFKQSTKNFNFFNPYKEKWVYKKYSQNLKETDSKKINIKVFSGMIHAIDGAIVWNIIKHVYIDGNNNTIISHLRDFIQVHCSYLNKIYKSIKKVYSDKINHKFTCDYIFFDHAINLFKKDSQKNIFKF